MQANLIGKKVIITGASRGLGLALAEKLWHLGATLHLVARNEESLNKIKNSFLQKKNASQSIEIYCVDLTKSNDVTSLANIFRDQEIEILINNAAIIGPIGPCWENDWPLWEKTLQANLTTPIMFCRSVLPFMIKNKFGKIINLSGGGAAQNRPNFSAYAVAKTGLVRFTEILAEEVKSFNIDVNCIAPGVMKTDMLAEILAAGENTVGSSEFITAKKQSQSEDPKVLPATDLCAFLLNEGHGISGKLISAVWDPWKSLTNYVEELKSTDIYTLRRILPKDRGKNWE